MTKEQTRAEVLKSDKTKCFICQDKAPTKEATREGISFFLCSKCASAVESENNKRNRIKAALDQNKIFQYTLGINTLPVRITIRDIQ